MSEDGQRRTRRAQRYQQEMPGPDLPLTDDRAEHGFSTAMPDVSVRRRRAQQGNPGEEQPRYPREVQRRAEFRPVAINQPRAQGLQETAGKSVYSPQGYDKAVNQVMMPQGRDRREINKTAKQNADVNAVYRPHYDAPRPKVKQGERRKMPVWLWSLLVLSLLVVIGQWYGQTTMQAYLDRKEREREKAHQQLLDAHPVYYVNEIKRYADEYNLEPAYVAAIILNESSFRPDAESSVGARGLMQLMESTAQWIAGKLKVPGYSFDRMYDPESNIRFGTWYLNYLSGLYRGDPVCVTAAYHAGQGEVNGWLSQKQYSDDGVTMDISRMPEGPTKTYVRRVTQDYAIYSALFANPDSLDDGTLLVGTLRNAGAGR